MDTQCQQVNKDVVSGILRVSPFRWRASVSTAHSTVVHGCTLDGDPVLYMFIVLGGRATFVKHDGADLCGGAMFVNNADPITTGVLAPSTACTYLLIELAPPTGSLRRLSSALPSRFVFEPSDYKLTLIRSIHQRIADEINSTEMGSSSTIGKLIDVLFTDCLRERAKNPAFSLGLLAALNDPKLSKAIQAMHDNPGSSWRLNKLASIAGMSRTAFAVLFAEVVGTPPLRYLMEVRMTLAVESLQSADITVAETAYSLGYASESAFYKAFKIVHGMSPRHFIKSLK